MQTRIWDYRTQRNREARGDAYYEAFYRHDGRGDGYTNAANRIPEYEARYWRPGRRLIPLDYGYLRDFNFELGEQ